MIAFESVGAQICVIGRTDFATGAGGLAYGTAETLARNFPVGFRPIEPDRQASAVIELPNGRRLPVLGAGATPVASFFCDDVGGAGWSMLPTESMVYAWLPFDRLARVHVERLNQRADVVLAPSPDLIETARRSGVTRPITALPIPLDLDGLLARPLSGQGACVRFGGRGEPTLVAALLDRFAEMPGVRLVLDAVNSASIDVFVSCDGGGAREALAMGKVVVIGDGRGDFAGLPGVFIADAALGTALGAAQRFVTSGEVGRTAMARRMAARQWSFSALAGSVGALIDPSIARFRPAQPPAPTAETVIEQRLGRRGDAIGGTRRQVCPAYDAGFFSIFNAFISHLVWQEREHRCHSVLPDWDVERLIARQAREGLQTRSFCYGQPGDGNLWLKLFQPLFGASEAEMQDEAFLWRHAEAPSDRHNEAREPHLTYVRAYTLYRSRAFASVRRQYHRVFARHVRLRSEHAAEIEAFAATFLDVPIRIAAHVRHPSHTVEQPDGRIAHTEAYIARVRDEVRRRGADPDGDGWAVFVATDQAAVLERFRAAFGARAVFYPEARRTRADEDAAFAALSPAEQNRDGHQLQHLVAADRRSWNWRMAWEVVRDAYTMARCQALLHVVSNVSTAVSYMNPELEMIFCEA